MKTLCISLLLLSSMLLIAQKDEATALNEMFKGRYHFDANKKGLTLELLKEGDAIRTDAFSFMFIDWDKVYYDEVGNEIEITCLEKFAPCIDRRIMKTKSRQQYPKTEIKVKDEKEAQRAINKLRSMAGL
ncbi:MAG: hypothetical protein RIE58_06370 [Vicingaceae bacterium]